MTKDLIRLLGLDEQDDLDLSDNPLSTQRVSLTPDEFFLISSQDYFNNIQTNSIEIILGSIKPYASRYYDIEIKRVEKLIHSQIPKYVEKYGQQGALDLLSVMYGSDEYKVSLYQLDKDTYFINSTDNEDDIFFFVGYNSPFKRDLESTLSKQDGALMIFYEEELEEVVERMLKDTRFREIETTEDSNHFIEFAERHIKSSNITEDFDLSDNPLSSNLFKDPTRKLDRNEIEKFCKSIENDKFKFSDVFGIGYDYNIARFVYFINDDLALYFKVFFDDTRRHHEEKATLKVCTSIGFTKMKENSYQVFDSIAVNQDCEFVKKSDNNSTVRESINSKMDRWSRSLISGYENNNSYVMKALEDLDKKMN